MTKESKLEKVNDNKETGLPLKSELLQKQKDLSEKNDKLLKEMQERTYSISFGKAKVFRKLLKFLEKDAPWSHTTAAGLIMLTHNLREKKDETRDNDWDGKLDIRSANVSILFQMLTKMTGNGFFEARDFVELMTEIGESISTAHNQFIDDNQELRDTHQKLSEVDQQIDEGRFSDSDESEN